MRALGVYRYATQGSESVQSPISDTTHDYDGVSTVVVLRRSASATTDTGLGGGTHYGEHYTIELLDTQPRR